MDALSGYGSSSSSDDDEQTSKPEEEQQKRRANDAEESSGGTTIRIKKENSSSTSNAVVTAAPSSKKRGKKILSLASVLPRHILERWTNANWDDDDDDSDDDDDRSRPHTQKDNTPAAPRTNSKNTEIAALLRDLQKVAPLQRKIAAAAAAPDESIRSGAGNYMDSNVDSTFKQAESLGSAFITSVVVTTNKASSTDATVVRDIHGEQQPNNPQSKSQPGALNDYGPADAPPQVSQQPFFGVEPDSRPRKPASRLINAAPRILQHVATSSSSSSVGGGMPPQPLHQPSPHPEQQHHPTEAVDGIAGRSKRSRQEMERALRQGRVAQVVGDPNNSITHHVESVDPSAYAPPPPPTVHTTPATTLRNVPMPRYDPALGSTTTTTTTSHGSRNNPIHQLLSQAVQLEQQRLQQSSTGTTTNVKLHRANAKRKYGW